MAGLMDHLRNLDRRWWVAIAVAVVAVVALVLSQTWFREYSREDCQPVRELLDYNKSQSERIQEFGEEEAMPIWLYQQWADGLAEHAQRVNNPDLAAEAIQLADLAGQFTAKLPSVPTGDTGSAPPPVLAQMSLLNDQITASLRTLDSACPA